MLSALKMCSEPVSNYARKSQILDEKLFSMYK